MAQIHAVDNFPVLRCIKSIPSFKAKATGDICSVITFFNFGLNKVNVLKRNFIDIKVGNYGDW